MKMKTFSDIVNYRFKELMRRDPLVTDFLKKYQQYAIQCPKVLGQAGILVMPEQLLLQEREISKKWNTAVFEFDPNGGFQVQKIQGKVREHTPVMSISDVIIPDAIKARGCDVFPKQPDHVYLDIDLSTVDMGDEKDVKKQVWGIIKTKVEERQTGTKGNRKKPQSQPNDDPPELAFFYHCREDIFRNYLRWYDIYTQEKLGFRVIAFLDEIRNKDVMKYEQWFIKLRTTKFKVRKPIKEEDNIEKAVKIIWEAIRREPYSRQMVEPVIEEWSCPEHGNKCSPSCDYYKNWENRFNKLMPLYEVAYFIPNHRDIPDDEKMRFQDLTKIIGGTIASRDGLTEFTDEE
jgi:hypothetical protein